MALASLEEYLGRSPPKHTLSGMNRSCKLICHQRYEEGIDITQCSLLMGTEGHKRISFMVMLRSGRSSAWTLRWWAATPVQLLPPIRSGVSHENPLVQSLLSTPGAMATARLGTRHLQCPDARLPGTACDCPLLVMWPLPPRHVMKSPPLVACCLR
jgi:hypothetical protein